MRLFKLYKTLPTGLKRIIIVGYFVLPLIIITTVEGGDGEALALTSVIFYWFVVFIGLWIYEGFKNDKKV